MALRANVPQPVLLGVFILLTLSYFFFTRHPDKAIAAYSRISGLFRRAPTEGSKVER
jgi:hypothetical protein